MSDNNKRNDDDNLSFKQTATYAFKYFLGLPRKAALAGKEITTRQFNRFMDAGVAGKIGHVVVIGLVSTFASMVLAGQMYTLNNDALPDEPNPQGSVFVTKMIQMVDAESRDGYGPSAAFYKPIFYNLNRNAFQRGEMDAWWTIMNGMQQFVMTEGTGQATDPDLVNAFNSLKRTNDWSISNLADTAQQMNKAVECLKRYNDGLVKGKKTFVPTIANINFITPIMSGLLLTEHNKVMDAVQNNSKYNIYSNRDVYFHALGVMRATFELSKGVFADHADVLRMQSTMPHALETIQRLGVNIGESRGFLSKNATFILNGGDGDFLGNDLVRLANDLLRAKDKMDDVPKNFGGAASSTPLGTVSNRQAQSKTLTP